MQADGSCEKTLLYPVIECIRSLKHCTVKKNKILNNTVVTKANYSFLGLSPNKNTTTDNIHNDNMCARYVQY